MCVSLSQKPMQSARVLPPPPGALGLPDEEPGDSARLLAPVEPPVENCVGSDGERGAIAGAWGAGDPTMEGGVEAPGVTGAGGGPLLMVPPLDEAGLVGRVGLGDERPPEPEQRACAVTGPPDGGLPMPGATTRPTLWPPPPAPRASAASDRSGIVRATAATSGQTRDTSMGSPFSFRQHPREQRAGAKFVRYVPAVAANRWKSCLENRQPPQWT